MILKDGVKHACRSCITGHRSSKCVHHDRELFPIAKKGRPSSQCKNCKTRPAANGRNTCECQVKRKPKPKAVDGIQPEGYQPDPSFSEASTSRKDSGTSGSYPASEDDAHGRISRTQSYSYGFVDGSSTQATNSGASSPSYSQQTFAYAHQALDPHTSNSGLYQQPADAPYAFHSQPHYLETSEQQLELPPPRPLSGAVRSRPVTAGEDDTPWWLYRAGYSPNPGLPYNAHHAQVGGGQPETAAPSHVTPGVFPEYAHYLSHPSPYMTGSPGNGLQSAPNFVWHNNATSYRDYMATQQVSHQQQDDASHNHPPRMHSHQEIISGAERHHTQLPSMSHHHSHPYMPRQSISRPPPVPAPHSAPQPTGVVSRPDVVDGHSSSWQQQHSRTDYGPAGTHYLLPSVTGTQSGQASFNPEHRAESGEGLKDKIPTMSFDSGSSRMTSAESIPSIGGLPTPIPSGCATAIPDKGGRYEKHEYGQSSFYSREGHLRERRSTSFDQVIPRVTSLNLRLPEDRKKRMVNEF